MSKSATKSSTVISLYAYTAQHDDELTFDKDCVITVSDKSNPDWWSGELDGVIGFFPSSYVKPALTAVQAVALFDYVAQKDDELSFDKDCLINVLDKTNADWWRGEYDGFTGVFPSNHVKLIGQTETEKPALASQPAPVPKRQRAHLSVFISEGFNIIAADPTGTSDPYCVVSLGYSQQKTKVIKSTLNPKWNEILNFTVNDAQRDILTISVYDKDRLTKDDFLGRATVHINDILSESKQTGSTVKRLKLQEVARGEIVVRFDLTLN